MRLIHSPTPSSWLVNKSHFQSSSRQIISSFLKTLSFVYHFDDQSNSRDITAPVTKHTSGRSRQYNIEALSSCPVHARKRTSRLSSTVYLHIMIHNTSDEDSRLHAAKEIRLAPVSDGGAIENTAIRSQSQGACVCAFLG